MMEAGKSEEPVLKGNAEQKVHPLAEYMADNEQIKVYRLNPADGSVTLCIEVPRSLGPQFKDIAEKSGVVRRDRNARNSHIWLINSGLNKKFVDDAIKHVVMPALRRGDAYSGDEIVLTRDDRETALRKMQADNINSQFNPAQAEHTKETNKGPYKKARY